jgi:hypothetical protein
MIKVHSGRPRGPAGPGAALFQGQGMTVFPKEPLKNYLFCFCR